MPQEKLTEEAVSKLVSSVCTARLSGNSRPLLSPKYSGFCLESGLRTAEIPLCTVFKEISSQVRADLQISASGRL